MSVRHVFSPRRLPQGVSPLVTLQMLIALQQSGSVTHSGVITNAEGCDENRATCVGIPSLARASFCASAFTQALGRRDKSGERRARGDQRLAGPDQWRDRGKRLAKSKRACGYGSCSRRPKLPPNIPALSSEATAICSTRHWETPTYTSGNTRTPSAPTRPELVPTLPPGSTRKRQRPHGSIFARRFITQATSTERQRRAVRPSKRIPPAPTPIS